MNKIIEKFDFKKDLDLEFEIVDIGKLYQAKKAGMSAPHRAQFYHVLWINKGRGTHFVDFNPIHIEDNCIIVIPQNSVNMFDPNGSYEGKGIFFTDTFFSKNPQDIKYLQTSILFSDLYDAAKFKVNPDISELKVILNAMETEFQKSPDCAQSHVLYHMIHIFLLQAEREMRRQGFKELQPSAHLDYLVIFKDMLEDRFQHEKSVNKYAAELGISEKQLHKATTTLLDKTPKQLIDERVLLEAKRLLVHTTMTIKEIAYELGYDEPTNFIKYFRKHTSLTPSEFRAQY